MSVDPLVNEGLAHHRAGRWGQAEALYHDVLRRQPGNTQALYLLGTLYGQTGRPDAAIQALGDVLARRPDFADAHNSLGVAYQARGDLAAAEARFRKAIALAPGHVSAHNNLGGVLHQRGDVQGAIAQFRRTAALDPARADAFLNLGKCCRQAQDIEGALEAFERAATLRPGHAPTLAGLAEVLTEAGLYDQAVEVSRRVVALTPDDPKAHVGLGSALRQRGDLDAALAAYDDALAHDPRHPEARAGKARVLERKGDLEGALGVVEEETEGDTPAPWAVSAFASLSRRLGRTDEALERIERALAGEMPAEERQRLHFGAGDLYDRAGAYDEAFGHYRRANELSPYPFAPAAHADRTNRLIEAFSRQRLERLPRARHGSDVPVFVVGMPRSGTTLTERIIASHPRAFGAGELPDIARLIADLPRALGARAAYPECIEALTVDAADRLAERYLARLRELGRDALRVVDKMPQNFLNLGLLSLLFPEARVIHVRRNPVDTCLSCYFQNFRRGHAYSFDLGHLGFVYREYRRLMAHWQATLGPWLHEVRYEDLVARQEAESRRLIDLAGLPWDDACLRFHEARRPVLTASYDQVSRPMYDASVERWRHYEKHLGPLLEALGPDAE